MPTAAVDHTHPKLKDWVAKPEDDSTALVTPVFIDAAAADLIPYHPVEVHTKPFILRHIADGTQTDPFARVTDLTAGSWTKEFIDIQSLLKLKPKTIKGVDVLLDDKIGNVSPTIRGWKVTRWVVVKGFQVASNSAEPRDQLLLVHNDLISWTRGAEVAMSTLSWRAYASLQ